MSQPTYVEMSLSTIGGDMKRLLLTGASLLALMAADPANASTVILYSGPAITLFTAPAAGAYEIVAYGAESGGASPERGRPEMKWRRLCIALSSNMKKPQRAALGRYH
jgi:hypothetical protein